MKKTSLHENLQRRQHAKVSSERSFAFVFAGVFFIVGLLAFKTSQDLSYIASGVGTFFLLCGVIYPKILRPLNIMWFKIGVCIFKITNPIIMGMLFFTTIVPLGLVMRLAGKNLLSLRKEPNSKTYWVVRDPPGPDPTSMKNQF